MSFFDRLAATSIRALLRLRRAAERFFQRPRSTRSLDPLLRARLREVEDANAYRDANPDLFAAGGLGWVMAWQRPARGSTFARVLEG
jgi:hypothetical protein